MKTYLFILFLFSASFVQCINKTKKNKDCSYKKEFIYRIGNKLMLNGKPYRSASFNSFQLSGCGLESEIFINDQIDSLFALLPKNLLVRTWAFPGYTEKIPRVIQAAEKYGIKLILTLGDGRSHCGHTDGAKGGDGSGKIPEWYISGFRKEYLSHVRKMTIAYKNSPAIAMWEILNEPGDAGWKTIQLFLDEVAAEIKKNDPNHLVSSGSWAPWAYDGVENFQAMHESPNIDVGSLHEYDYDYNRSNTIESPHFAGALQAMNNLDKVLIVGETGIESGISCRTSLQTRANAMKEKFNIYLQKGAQAVLVWNLARSTRGCNLTFTVDDPLFELIRTYPVNLEK